MITWTFLSLLLLALAPQALAWEITVTGPVTIRGEGALPTLTVAPSVAPPVVLPPATAPVVIPAVTPPARDPAPFTFPPCVGRQVDHAERAAWVWRYPGDFQDFYAYLHGGGNPLPSSHTCAGIFRRGATTAAGKVLDDLQLWVPRSAGTERPWDIRCVLATGRACP